MADILIRKVDEGVKALLKRRAARHGRSLEADLRETLERLARDEAETPDDAEPFGTWLVRISRPGADLDAAVEELRAGPMRDIGLE